MIGPVSILSLAAVSAAEATSSGKRGLREKTSIWVPIGIITGTALVSGTIMAVSFYFIGKANGGGGAGYKIPTATAANYYKQAAGCINTRFQSKTDPTDGSTPECDKECTGGKYANTRHPDEFTPFGETTLEKACTVCQANHYWNGDSGCAACISKYTMPGKLEAASGTAKSAPEQKKICLPKCGTNAGDVASLTADGDSCLCGPSTGLTKDNTVQCTKGTHETCKITSDKGECA